MLQNIHKGQVGVSGDLSLLYLLIVLGFLTIQGITFTHTKNQGLFKSKKRTRETAKYKAHKIRNAEIGPILSPLPLSCAGSQHVCKSWVVLEAGAHTALHVLGTHYAQFWKTFILTPSFFYYPGEGNKWRKANPSTWPFLSRFGSGDAGPLGDMVGDTWGNTWTSTPLANPTARGTTGV